ncbi:hypothetical protein [Sphingomicrobium astaxanthinifaciens]|uniref:hypothetical protein n=1 Tax=Sphingomicrobium astaxanthinifaciens TaxID=1227949 RepID=UPI001FCC5328|nr:hypothetical protein [Sphingomicrobium astaxanthinifaciens]MCJ7421469.1 hypothetical protein [Sphingomicrobium astaxanthinifaciens]
MTFFVTLLTALAALWGAPALPAASVNSASETCSVSVTDATGINAQREEARWVLANIAGGQAQATPQRVQRLQVANPQAEIAMVKRTAREALNSRAMTAQRRAIEAVEAVARYDGNDPMEMNRLLSRAERAGDQLYAVLSSGGTSSPNYETKPFKCNSDRQKCKADCQASKGQSCCCGCGVTFIGCLVLG